MTRLGSLISCAALGFGVTLLGCGSTGGSSGSTSSQGGSSGSTGGSSGSTGGSSGSTGGSSGSGGMGGTSGGGILDVIKLNNAKVGPDWTVDTDSTNVGAGEVAALATTEDEAENTPVLGQDGAAVAFYENPIGAATLFALQNYVNSTLNAPDGYTLLLYVLQMPSAAMASGLYSYLPTSSAPFYYPFYHVTWEEPTTQVVGVQSRISNTGSTWWINFYKGVYYVEIQLSSSNMSTTNSSSTAAKSAAIDFAKNLASGM
jgi:hypothetical protein